MAKRKDSTETNLIANALNIIFRVLKDKSAGRCVINIKEIYADREQVYELAAKIDSLWIDEHSGNAIKVHMRLSTGNSAQKKLMRALKELGVISCPKNRFLTLRGNSLRYGVKPGVLYRGEDENYSEYYVYDSKIHAIRACIAEAKEYKLIGGIDAVSLAAISDALLEEFGFVKVEDTFKIGVPMWRGDASRFLKFGKDYANSRELRNNAEAFVAALRKYV